MKTKREAILNAWPAAATFWEVSNTVGTDPESFTGSGPYVSGLISLVLANGLWSKPLWGLKSC